MSMFDTKRFKPPFTKRFDTYLDDLLDDLNKNVVGNSPDLETYNRLRADVLDFMDLYNHYNDLRMFGRFSTNYKNKRLQPLIEIAITCLDIKIERLLSSCDYDFSLVKD